MQGEQPTKCFVPLQKPRLMLGPSSSLLTVPRRLFCCGALLKQISNLYFSVRIVSKEICSVSFVSQYISMS